MLIRINEHLFIDPADITIYWADVMKDRVFIKTKNDSVAWFLPIVYREQISNAIQEYLSQPDNCVARSNWEPGTSPNDDKHPPEDKRKRIKTRISTV
jgi:hypothetical protein